MTTTSPTRLDAHASTARSGPGRIRLVAGALAAASATVAVLLATTPWGDRLDSSSDEVLDYDKLLGLGNAAWPSMLLDSFAYAVIGVTLALGVLHLVRDRGPVSYTHLTLPTNREV